MENKNLAKSKIGRGSSANKFSNFELSVFSACKKIPFGKVSTYSSLARSIGEPKASRAVGNALNKSLGMPSVPCHRIVKSNGEVGGFAFGTKKKILLLKNENVKIKNNKIINFKKLKF